VTQLLHKVADTIVKNTATMGMTLGVRGRQDVVLTVLDTCRTKEMVYIVATRIFINPFTDGVEHVTLDLDALVTQCRMVEGAQYVSTELVNGHTSVFPRI
jgi:hypothetical protein